VPNGGAAAQQHIAQAVAVNALVEHAGAVEQGIAQVRVCAQAAWASSADQGAERRCRTERGTYGRIARSLPGEVAPVKVTSRCSNRRGPRGLARSHRARVDLGVEPTAAAQADGRRARLALRSTSMLPNGNWPPWRTRSKLITGLSGPVAGRCARSLTRVRSRCARSDAPGRSGRTMAGT